MIRLFILLILLLALPTHAGWYAGFVQAPPKVRGSITQTAFVSTQGTGCGPVNGIVTSPSFTPGANDLIVLACNAGTNTEFTPSSSAGLTFTERVRYSNAALVVIWTAPSVSTASQTVTCTGDATFNSGLFVWSLAGHEGVAQTVTAHIPSAQGAPILFENTTIRSWLISVGWNYTSVRPLSAESGSTNVLGGSTTYDDCHASTLWALRATTPSSVGGNVTVSGLYGVSGQESGIAGIEIYAY